MTIDPEKMLKTHGKNRENMAMYHIDLGKMRKFKQPTLVDV